MNTPHYEVRTNDNPKTMPFGTAVISWHRTAEEAHASVAEEQRRFAHSPYAIGGGYLQRLIILIDANGTEWIDRRA